MHAQLGSMCPGPGSAPCSWFSVQPAVTLPSPIRVQVAQEAELFRQSGFPAGEPSSMTNSGLVFPLIDMRLQ